MLFFSTDCANERDAEIARSAAEAMNVAIFMKALGLCLPSLQHDITDGFAAFNGGVGSSEVRGGDLAEHLVERGFDLVRVDHVRDVIQQFVLYDHVGGLEGRAGEH